MTVLCEIHHWGCFLGQTIDQAQISLVPTLFDEQTLHIQQRLLRLYHQELGEVELVVCLAALIHVEVGLRRIKQVPNAISTAFLSRLHKIVSKGRIAQTLSIWLFFIGLLGAQVESNQQQWLLNNLLQSTRSLEVAALNWTRLQMELEKSLWVDSILDSMGRTIWTKVEKMQHDAIKAAATAR